MVYIAHKKFSAKYFGTVFRAFLGSQFVAVNQYNKSHPHKGTFFKWQVSEFLKWNLLFDELNEI